MHVLARCPLIPRTRGTGPVKLVEYSFEQRSRQDASHRVDVGADGEGTPFDKRDRGGSVTQHRDGVVTPRRDHQICCPCGDREECLIERLDHTLSGCAKRRERAQCDCLVEAFGVSTKKRCVGAGDCIEHILAPPCVAHRDAPGAHAALRERMCRVGIDDPCDRRGIQIPSRDGQKPCCEGSGDRGVGETRSLAHKCRSSLAAAKERHAPGAHAATG